ncbi:MAG TPA: carboxypeptidase-like regulatory domain-containing protein, partial [Thermoanaerobaculia bacterium]|nr:carboxypeptidase-like regulatory domain-containing protein [Thermoanaerobaculia bacterium]
MPLLAAVVLAAITGSVVSDDGRAVAGARVAAFALETPDQARARWAEGTARVPLATAVTDSKGNFAMDASAPVVELSVGGVGVRAAGSDAGVLRGSGVPMTQGTITANGKPLAGATVIVVARGNESVAVTDASGRYALPDPARLPSRVIVRHPDYAIVERELGPVLPAKADVAMTAGVALRGRVVGADGETAVPNAVVLVDNLPLATTAADGTFTIAHAPPGAKRIVARAGNRIAARQLGKEANVVLRLSAAASIAGSVRDIKSGQAIAGALVVAAAPRFAGTDPGSSAITDARGNFRIDALAGGEYEVTAAHPAYAAARLTLNLPAGRAAQRALYAAPLATIAGSVVDEEKRGLGGAAVRSEITAADGRFLVRTAEEGTLQLEARKKGLPPGRSAPLRIVSGERKSGVVIVIPRGVVLAGRVVDRDARPIAAAAIAVGEPGQAVERRRMMMNSLERAGDDLVRSDAEGRFSMRVKEGAYDVVVTAAGFAPKTLPAQQVSAASRPLEIVLDPGVDVRGRVTRGGAPVDGVNVFTVGGQLAAPAQTAADGTFRIADLAPGQVALAFRKLGDFIQATRFVTAPAADVNVDLPAGGRVAGRVIDRASGQPVTAFDAGVAVARGGSGSASTMLPPVMRSFAAGDGAFAIDAVPVGAQMLVVTAPGYAVARVPNLKVEDGKSIDDVEVALDRGVSVNGRVTGPNGAAVGGAAVRVEPRAGGESPSTVTDPDGRYLIENLEAGETTLTFSRDGLLPAKKRVALSAAETEVDAQLGAGATIAGVVVADGGAPVPNAEVTATSPADLGGAKRAQSDDSGAFVIADAAPGHYEIRAAKSGFAEAVLRDVEVPAPAALRLVMKGGAVIAGRVLGVTSAEMSAAVVDAASPDGSASASPDAGGNYRIEGAPAGTVRVSGHIGSAAGARTAPVQSVRVEAGATANVDVDFGSDVVVRGRVTRGGAAVPGALVSFAPRAAGQRFARGAADENGRYEIGGIDKGSYSVTVTDVERGAYTTSLDVSGSTTFDIDMRAGALSGSVVDAATGAPLANATIEL